MIDYQDKKIELQFVRLNLYSYNIVIFGRNTRLLTHQLPDRAE